jgi:hypothetical protein
MRLEVDLYSKGNPVTTIFLTQYKTLKGFYRYGVPKILFFYGSKADKFEIIRSAAIASDDVRIGGYIKIDGKWEENNCHIE